MYEKASSIQKNIHFLAIYPFYINQKQIEKRDLAFARDTTILIVDEYVSRIKEVSAQISSRTKAKMLFQELIHSNKPQAEKKAYLTRILQAALNSNTQLISITRVDSTGKPIAQVGKHLPRDMLSNISLAPKLILLGPYLSHKEQQVIILSPIFSHSGKLIGQDICLFNISSLKSSIHQKLHLRLGEILIAYLKDNQFTIFSPVNFPWKQYLLKNPNLNQHLVNGITKREMGTTLARISKDEVFISFAPIATVPHWGVAVIIKKSTLFASLRTILFEVILFIFLVGVLLAIGLNYTLKPLTGKVILNVKELEEQISQARVELENANKELKRLALYDSLTQVLNRRGFEDILQKELANAKRYNLPLALFYIDINDFKKINDNLGHRAGDLILKDTIKHIKAAIREGDVIGRLGGDEFGIIALNLKEEHINEVLSKLKKLHHIPHSIEGEIVHSSISIGAACYQKNTDSMETLIARADKAMFVDKQRKTASKSQGDE